ncbi:spore germination protein [Sporanaerobacter acetigenes]|nr:spore germination protein [Sporanaerobacter acetigenes]
MVSKKIEENKKFVLDSFQNSSDLIHYEFEAGDNTKILIFYIEGFIDRNLLDRDIVKPLIHNKENKDIKKIISISSLSESGEIDEVISKITDGNVAIFFNGKTIAYLANLKNWEKRSIEEPQAEAVVRGPKEGFVEDISSNRNLLRKKIKSNNLVFEDYTVGKQTNTTISIAYINGIVNEDVLNEVRKRINSIDTDAILESGYIEQYIEDNKASMLPTIGNTQKPDVAAGKILEGRVAIFCDGSPHVLTVPKLFLENIQTSEDYYIRPHFASFLRTIRMFSLFLAIVLPGFYVALQTFHQEMIPTVLLVSMAEAREGVPFPAAIEAFLMIIMLELIKESGVRLPRAVGSAVSIVGALVLGQAAVQAGIVSAPMVIVIAVTAIAEFTVPPLTELLILYRLIILFLGAFAGLYGVTCGLVALIVQGLSLNSFGVSYGYPISPIDKTGLKDFVIRFPLWSFIFRPKAIEKTNMVRHRNTRKK